MLLSFQILVVPATNSHFVFDAGLPSLSFSAASCSTAGCVLATVNHYLRLPNPTLFAFTFQKWALLLYLIADTFIVV